jgi:hypothetical protein
MKQQQPREIFEKLRAKSAQARISEDEWNFDEGRVKECELLACCYWEYARESAFIMSVRERCRQAVVRGVSRKERDECVGADFRTIRASIGRTAHMFQEGIYGLGGKAPYEEAVSPFPQPWLTLGEGMRHILRETAEWKPSMAVGIPAFRWSHVARVSGLVGHLQRLQSSPEGRELREPSTGGSLEHFFWSGNIPRTQRPSFVYPSGLEVLLVEIEWRRFTNDQIVQCFRKWAKLHRPKDVKAPSGKGHKPRDWRASLERLGIMRLMNRYSFDDLQSIVQAAAPTKSADREKYSVKGGCKKEWQKALDDFHDLFPFLPDEEPKSCKPLPGCW